MALQGSLDTLALDDVIRLLAGTTKTGRLRLDGPGAGGSLWFAEGAVIGGEVSEGPAMPAAHALFELWRSDADRFEFVPGEVVPDAGDAVDADVLITEAGSRLARWQALAEVVPSVDASVALVTRLPVDEVSITRERWHLLTVVAAATTVRQVGDALVLDEFEVRQSIGDLVDAGLVELGDDVLGEAPVAAADVVTVEPPAADTGGSVVFDPPAIVAEPSSPAAPPRSDSATEVDGLGHRYLTGQGAEPGFAGLGGLPEPLPVGVEASAVTERSADDPRDPFAHAPVDTEPSRAAGGWDPFGSGPRPETDRAEPVLPTGADQGGFDEARSEPAAYEPTAFDRAGYDQVGFDQPEPEPAAHEAIGFDRADHGRPEHERDESRPEPQPVPVESSRTWWGGTR